VSLTLATLNVIFLFFKPPFGTRFPSHASVGPYEGFLVQLEVRVFSFSARGLRFADASLACFWFKPIPNRSRSRVIWVLPGCLPFVSYFGGQKPFFSLAWLYPGCPPLLAKLLLRCLVGFVGGTATFLLGFCSFPPRCPFLHLLPLASLPLPGQPAFPRFWRAAVLSAPMIPATTFLCNVLGDLQDRARDVVFHPSAKVGCGPSL